VKTLCGIERLKALPSWLGSDEARMQLGGCKAPPVRPGLCPRGATKRPGERAPGPLCPETRAKHRVKWHVRALQAVCNGRSRALATAGGCGAQVTGRAEGPDLETTARDAGCGQGTRTVRIEDQQGRVHEMEVTVYGWNVRRRSDAATQMPLAVKVGKRHEHEALWPRALVPQARLTRAGAGRRHKVSCDQGVLAGSTRWWLNPPGVTVVVPATTPLAVVAEARAQAVASAALALARRVPTVRHGPGRTAWTEGLETAVVGMTGLTSDDQYGTPAQGRQHNRRDFQPHLINAVVVRKWQGKDDGPGGKTVFRTHASVAKPLQPCDADDDRRRIEHCGINEAKQPWDLAQPPQKNERAVRVHVRFTVLMFALATAYRLPGEREAMRGDPVGWQRGRRQLLEQTRDQVIVCAQGSYGLLHLADYALLWGVQLKDVPPDSGGRHQVLAKYGLPAQV
jgi:hypothetical protein